MMKIYLLLIIVITFSCNTQHKAQQAGQETTFKDYYYRIDHLPKDSFVLTKNNKIVPKYLQDLDFLDGIKLPIFEAIDLRGLKKEVNYEKKLTLINFWFIRCPPCVEEIPFLNKMQNDHKESLEVISLCRDSDQDIHEFILEHPIDYTVIPNANHIIDDIFKFSWGYPKSILVDQEGIVLCMTRGFLGTDDINYMKIENLILDRK